MSPYIVPQFTGAPNSHIESAAQPLQHEKGLTFPVLSPLNKINQIHISCLMEIKVSVTELVNKASKELTDLGLSISFSLKPLLVACTNL
jgi:hypothetical protein